MNSEYPQNEKASSGENKVFVPVVCSRCFSNEGLILDATKIGVEIEVECPNCGNLDGLKLDAELLQRLAYRYFVQGTTVRFDYGAAPIIVYNNAQTTGRDLVESMGPDIELISEKLKVGFFHYGPRLWMLGEITPLKDLSDADTRGQIVARILDEYPERKINSAHKMYRVRINPGENISDVLFDSPPSEFLGRGRLDSPELPVLYASPDLQVCLHECRTSAEDDLFVATLIPNGELSLLDLSVLLKEEHITEFESLDHAVYFLFLAGSISYEICRDIAVAAHLRGFDGLIYPSYFSRVRTGAEPFETSFGLSSRLISTAAEMPEERRAVFEARENSRTVPNVALFGRPIRDRKVSVSSINKVFIERAEYHLRFGPIPDQY